VRTQNSRTSQTILAAFLLFIGLMALLDSANLFVTLLVLGGVFMLVRQFESRRGQSSDAELPLEQAVPERAASSQPRIYQHALQAVEAAGLDPETVKVLATDIGVMAFSGDSEPEICRSREIYDDVDYIQPYVQLRLATKAIGLIRFEIEDSDGQLVFVHEEHHQLERGRNLITTAARLPIHDIQAKDDDWSLRILADGVPLAVHALGWQESTTTLVRRHLSEDGEISSELRAAMAENRLQKMSLDDLLAEQDSQSQRR
jgi:hypothetical protein